MTVCTHSKRGADSEFNMLMAQDKREADAWDEYDALQRVQVGWCRDEIHGAWECYMGYALPSAGGREVDL